MEGEAFVANFKGVGTLDDTPYLCTKAALDWRKRVVWEGKRGEEAVMGYLHHLAREGGRKVAEVLETEVLDNEDESLSRCALVNVRLPLSTESTPADLGSSIMRRMVDEHGVAVVVLSYRGQRWVRLSAQVYLTTEDFERAAVLLRKVCAEASA